MVGIHYRTWQRWVSWDSRKGLKQPRFLSEEQGRELTEEVGSGRFKTGGEMREWIESGTE